MAKPNHPTTAPAQSALPDLGTLGMALRIVLLAETIALIVAIGRNPALDVQAWQDLKLLSMFALALALLSAVALMLFSPLLKRMSLATGSVFVVLLLLAVTAVGTDAVIAALHGLGLIADPWPPWRESLLVRTMLIAAIVGTLGLRYLILRHHAETEGKSQQEARMQALQSRIRPHFLFNSLNSVASLTRSDPARAEAVLHDLADLFRVLLADARKLVPISAEQEISRQYLALEKLRLGERLDIKWSVNNIPRSAQIPALTLQPLLENAIYHGIEPRFAGGTVKIEMWTEGEMLNIMISNPLPEAQAMGRSKGNRIALDNIRQRLATQFGGRASMQSFEEGGQYHVKVKMPIVLG